MPTSVYLLYDERMTLHRRIGTSFDADHLFEQDTESRQNDNFEAERPARILALYHALKMLERQLSQSHPDQRFLPLPCKPASKETICLAHSEDHYDRLAATRFLSDDELQELEEPNELYFCKHTFLAATLACGGVVECVNAVTEAFRTGVGSTRAIALVRPPGHHALRDNPMGFCFFNNTAVAAKHAIHSGRARRVFILDWDVHHGNGTQAITYDDPNIFYLSIHRANSDATFYPGTGQYTETGQGNGVGCNLNIVWSKYGMGNTEYAGAFAELVLPVMSDFNPDLIIIACGLDAAEGDLLGDCGLSPEMYYTMTESLLEELASDIPVVVALEGGYNLSVISNCMQAIALALLDEPYDDNRDECANLGHFWSPELLDPHSSRPKPPKHSKVFSAIKSIKRSARCLARSRLCTSAPIQMPRKVNVPFSTPSDFKERCRRLSLKETDRYPAKKRLMLRASNEVDNFSEDIESA